MKLSIALAACVLSFTAKNSSASLRGFDQEQLDGPFSKLKCTIEAKTDEDACSSTVTDEGEPCDYCTLNQDDDESGLCVNPEIAEQMKQLNPDVNCKDDDADEEVSSDELEDILSVMSTTAAALIEPSIQGPFSDLKCMIEARTDKDKCSTSVTDDGDKCSYCTVKSPGQDEESGLCVNPDVAQQMMQMNQEISCSNVEEEDAELSLPTINKDDFKCTLEALSDEEKCATTTTIGEEQKCLYCTIDNPNFDFAQGLCVSPDHADRIKDFGGENVSCNLPQNQDDSSGANEKPLSESNAVTDCNLKGIDDVTCLDPSKVNGSECVWCDAGIGGFCFPAGWKDTFSHFMTCSDSTAVVLEEEETVDEVHGVDPSFLSSSCFKVGLKGASPDDCRDAIDDETGEHCIFCSAPRLGGVGLCMTPDYRGNEGKFYSCDADDALLATA